MSESKSTYAAVKPAPDDARDGFDEAKYARRDKRIKVLRIIQSTLSALLSIAIAVFQGRVYWTYQNTKAVPGAWPVVPDVVPTILLFSVAVAALVFDICMIIAYLRPRSKLAPWAVRVGGAAHYAVASAKTVSYAISAVISKTSFDFGNNSGQNADLWSYTCTEQAAVVHGIQAESNCNSQYASWAFAICQLGLEIFGWVISILVLRQSDSRLSSQAVDERFTAYSGDVNRRMGEATPHFNPAL
ncbi:hypothetical protein B0H67DRAFT_638076 [Lasiosphaeris hirsuta]|uniref:Uncharacterized protein n=1 Tax=Lasiosphaeris hirsuta TaxID=260670 RepID=A0AA40B880_9PEZI|nr:hypothetical protein B0H67DRAFT_638076 [Lasiosphaeris hirsuta]